LKHDPKRYRSLAGAARAAMASHNVSEAQTYCAAMVAMADPKSSRESLSEVRAYVAV
jgi:hypothetical protein